MDNQVFIQSFSNTNGWADSTHEHEEVILHSLIEAQLTQGLAEIEELLERSAKKSDAELFTVSQNKKENVVDGETYKAFIVQSPVDYFLSLGTFIKSSWIQFKKMLFRLNRFLMKVTTQV